MKLSGVKRQKARKSGNNAQPASTKQMQGSNQKLIIAKLPLIRRIKHFFSLANWISYILLIKTTSLFSSLFPPLFLLIPLFCQDCPRLVHLRSRGSLISTPWLARRGPPAWRSHTTRCLCWQEWDQVRALPWTQQLQSPPPPHWKRERRKGSVKLDARATKVNSATVCLTMQMLNTQVKQN